MKKNDFGRRIFYSLLFIFLMVFSIFCFSTNDLTVEAEKYESLDFSDTKIYNFDANASYEGAGWKIEKDGHDYTLTLDGVKAERIIMPMDDADKDCSILNCGTKPRQTNVKIIINGDNTIYGTRKVDDGLVGNYVKNTTIEGNGKLTLNSTHGISIYSDVIIEDGLTFNINSKVYGITTNQSLTIKGSKFDISSGDSSLISAEDMLIEKAVINAKIPGENGSTFAANKGIIESVAKVTINNSQLDLRRGNSAIVGKDVEIYKSDITNSDEPSVEHGIWANGPANGRGNLTIKDSTVNLKANAIVLKATGNLILDGGKYNLEQFERRKSVVEGGSSFVLTNKAELNAIGKGFGVSTTRDGAIAEFKAGTKANIAITGAVVADKYSVDQYAVSSDKTYLESGLEFEALGPNHVFSYSPTFIGYGFYVEAGEFAETNPKMRYAKAMSKDYFKTFHSTYRYVKIIYKDDIEAPKISGYTEGQKYCSLPVLTVTDDTGIDSVYVNGEKIRKFSTDTDTKKVFMVPILNSPIKEVVVRDVVGNEARAHFTAYNGCAVDITTSRVSYGGTFVYDGKEKKPIVSIYYMNRKLKENADYKINYSNNIEPGIATITITGIGGFEGTITKTFEIQKATNKITASADVNKVYSGKAQTIYLGANQTGNGNISYKSNNSGVTVDQNGTTVIKANFAGTAKITITSTETKEYAQATEYVNINVKKANNNITASNFTKNYNKKAQSFAINAKQTGNAKLTYKSNNKNITVNANGKVTIKAGYIGKATITITANQTTQYNKATKNITVVVNPASIKISKLTNSKGKKLVVKWSKNTTVTGYQVQYSTDKNFKKGVKTVTIKKNKTTSTTISKLTKGKRYYVRIRTYKNVSGANYYSGWSSSKNIKITK